MNKHPASSWSESLQQQTRNAIELLPMTRDGNLHFKHPTLSGAFVKLGDLCNDRLVLISKSGLSELAFEDVEALLQAGWAVD